MGGEGSLCLFVYPVARLAVLAIWVVQRMMIHDTVHGIALDESCTVC
ncbi:uncharacterized protein J3R85_018494 [Psidium guajava]|nr:uncharacterized protein J3R85_018494 [Psidium guajava]